MMNEFLNFVQSVSITTVFCLSSGQSWAVTEPGNILADDEANNADATTLVNEASVFESIRMGIALSMAQCEGLELCSPSVNEDELKQLIQTLDSRIDNLTLRQEEVEDPEGFDEILAIYVNERDNYAHIMEKLSTLSEDMEPVGLEAEEEAAVSEKGFDIEIVDETVSEEAVDLEDELKFFEDEELE